MTQRIMKYLTLSLILLTLAACGGDVYKSATVKISLTGTLPPDKAIIGALFTLTLPADVTPELVSGEVASSVVTPSGTFAGGTQFPVVYKVASGSTHGSVTIALVNASITGVTEVGEVATVTLNLTNYALPTASSFTLDQAKVKVTDTSGNKISGLSATVSGVELR